MKTTDNNFYEEVRKQVEPLLNDLNNGKSAREIAAAIYMTLTDKTEDVASEMAGRVVEAVNRYHDGLENCLYKDKDGSYKDGNYSEFIENALKDSVKDIESPIERSEKYYHSLIALRAYSIYMEGGADAEQKAKDYVEANKNFPYDDDTAVQMEQRLFELNVEAIENTDIITAQLPAILAAMKDENFDQAMGIYAFGRESADIKVVLSMQAYVNSVNGVYEDIDADADIDAVTTTTCAAVDTYSAIAQEATGRITKETLKTILRAIGYVAAAIFAAYLAYHVTIFVFLLLIHLFATPSFPLLAVILALVASFAVAVGVVQSDLIDKAGNVGVKVVNGFIRAAEFTFGMLKKGVGTAIEFTKPYIPRIVEWFDKLKEDAKDDLRLIKAFFTGEKTVENETENEPEEGDKAEAQEQAETEASDETPETQKQRRTVLN